MNSPVYLGMMGSFGRSYANRAVEEADLLILCGARVADRAVENPEEISAHAKIIHIDIDPAEIGKNIHVDVPIVGDVRDVLSTMTKEVEPVNYDEWRKTVMRYKAENVCLPERTGSISLSRDPS